MDRLDAFATSRRDYEAPLEPQKPREEGTAAWAQASSTSSEPTATICDWFLEDKYFSVQNGRGLSSPGTKNGPLREKFAK